jgi:uncharacterized protein (DUF2235 family)
MKRIVICADGTWNRPEEDLEKDFPTNVLKLARAIRPIASDGVAQQVFYDWGIGSYHDRVVAGATGKGLHKNILDGYRYLVQNYSPGDEIYLIGVSRGAYTVRSLCGLINNCGIIKRPDARLIQKAFEIYKKPGKKHHPDGDGSVQFRRDHSHAGREVHFVGAWDTVGAMGIPFSFLGLFQDKDEFYDTKIGRNVRIARHALAIDEFRRDFEPTIWQPRPGLDLTQVWFAGAHSDVGGSYRPDRDGSLLADYPLKWMIHEAASAGLVLESHLRRNLNPNPIATLHRSRRNFYRLKKTLRRPIDHDQGEVRIHQSVQDRWNKDPKYRPQNLRAFIDENGWSSVTT